VVADGTKIVFASGDLMCFDDCRVSIYVASVDGSSVVPLVGLGPDGIRVRAGRLTAPRSPSSVGTVDVDADIYVMNADGSGAVN